MVRHSTKVSISKRKLPKELKTAYQSWLDQRHRCNNPNNHSYKYYGAKGVKVKYNSIEFVNWWKEQLKIFKGKKPTVSRIDHNGHYEFGNIKLEAHIDNCVWDTIKRNGPPGIKCKRKILILDYKSKEPIIIAESGVEAERLTGVKRTNIVRICKGLSKYGKGFTFEYYDK